MKDFSLQIGCTILGFVIGWLLMTAVMLVTQ